MKKLERKNSNLKHFIFSFDYKGEALALLLFILSFPSYSQSAFDFFFEDNPFRLMQDMQLDTNTQFDLKWSDEGEKKILTISPKEDSEVMPNIEIENQMLKVTGKIVKTETVERDGVKSSSQYMSTFSFASQLPDDVDGEKVVIEQVDNTIKLTFPKLKRVEKSPPSKKSKELQELKNLPGEYI